MKESGRVLPFAVAEAGRAIMVIAHVDRPDAQALSQRLPAAGQNELVKTHGRFAADPGLITRRDVAAGQPLVEEPLHRHAAAMKAVIDQRFRQGQNRPEGGHPVEQLKFRAVLKHVVIAADFQKDFLIHQRARMVQADVLSGLPATIKFGFGFGAVPRNAHHAGADQVVNGGPQRHDSRIGGHRRQLLFEPFRTRHIVRIHRGDPGISRFAHAYVASGAVAPVIAPQDAYAIVLRLMRRSDFRRVVRRTVVHDNQFQISIRLPPDALNSL